MAPGGTSSGYNANVGQRFLPIKACNYLFSNHTCSSAPPAASGLNGAPSPQPRQSSITRPTSADAGTTSGSASDFVEEEERGPIDIDTESGEITGEDMEGETFAPAPDSEPDPGQDEIAVTGLPEAEMAGNGSEEAADALIEEPALPAEPDVMAQDPVHQDVVWLCENWALPRIASPAPRPAQIIVSLADKAIPFAAYDPDVVQLFEAFRLPPDRDACEWEPW